MYPSRPWIPTRSNDLQKKESSTNLAIELQRTLVLQTNPNHEIGQASLADTGLSFVDDPWQWFSTRHVRYLLRKSPVLCWTQTSFPRSRGRLQKLLLEHELWGGLFNSLKQFSNANCKFRKNLWSLNSRVTNRFNFSHYGREVWVLWEVSVLVKGWGEKCV